MSEPVLTQPTDSPVSASARRLTQFLLVGTTVACFVIFWWASRLLGVPAELRLGGSLLQQPTVGTTVIGLLAAIALLAGCTLFAGALLEQHWIFGGMCAATAGLSAWSMRGGPMRQVLFYAPSTTIFAKMAFELLVLGGAVAVIWCMVWRRQARRGRSSSDPGLDSGEPAEMGRWLTAVAVQVLVMGALMLLLAKTDAKKQAVLSVLIAAITGTGVAEAYFAGPQSARWYWIGPLVVGVFGYLAALISNGAWENGTRELAGPFAALARALPTDYASVGMCGALLGYGWMTPEGEDNRPINPKSAGVPTQPLP